jgi:hypothetical protein
MTNVFAFLMAGTVEKRVRIKTDKKQLLSDRTFWRPDRLAEPEKKNHLSPSQF